MILERNKTMTKLLKELFAILFCILVSIAAVAGPEYYSYRLNEQYKIAHAAKIQAQKESNPLFKALKAEGLNVVVE